uniref:Protein kinase domain-containing protein n=1 Tax=Plectus sambesii TaxID=2011161 RepID=A0A914UTW7_9BILA
MLGKKGHSFEVDIWAIGCILYTLLVGKPPFETQSLKDTYQKIKKNEYHVPSRIGAHAAHLLNRLLAPEPSARPNIHEILAFDFFTQGYLPSRLPTSCLTMAPKFPSMTQLRSGNDDRRALVDINSRGTRLNDCLCDSMIACFRLSHPVLHPLQPPPTPHVDRVLPTRHFANMQLRPVLRRFVSSAIAFNQKRVRWRQIVSHRVSCYLACAVAQLVRRFGAMRRLCAVRTLFMLFAAFSCNGEAVVGYPSVDDVAIVSNETCVWKWKWNFTAVVIRCSSMSSMTDLSLAFERTGQTSVAAVELSDLSASIPNHYFRRRSKFPSSLTIRRCGRQVLFGRHSMAGLANHLRYLSLLRCPLVDFSWLWSAGLARLEHLAICESDLQFFNALTGFDSLKALDLSGNDLRAFDFGALSALPKLKRLILRGNGLVTVTASTVFNNFALTHLRELDLGENDISDIPSPLLASFKKLAVLNLARNSISSLSFMTLSGVELHTLRRMNISFNPLLSISEVFVNAPNLHELDLTQTNMAGLGPDDFENLLEIKE